MLTIIMILDKAHFRRYNSCKRFC